MRERSPTLRVVDSERNKVRGNIILKGGKMEQLTKAQGKVLKGIISFIRRYDFPPTIREIMKDLKFTSPGTVQDHLRRLADKNYIRLKPGLSRGIELAPELLGIPVGGFIGAGKTFAETNPEGYIDPGTLVPKDENTFALRVAGESMRDRKSVV